MSGRPLNRAPRQARSSEDRSIDGMVAAIEEHQRSQSIRTARMLGGSVFDRGDVLQYVSGSEVAFTNGVIGARFSKDHADERIEEVVDTFARHGVPAIWWIGPASSPPDLGRRIERHGFVHAEAMPWLAADLRAALAECPPVPEGLDIRRVHDEEGESAWIRAMADGFGLAGPVREVLSILAARAGSDPEGPWVRFVGMLQGRPIASSGLSVSGGRVAAVYNVSTVPAARRRGIGGAMSLAAMRHAATLGYGMAVLGTSTMARSLYEGLGFREVCVLHTYAWEPPRR
jgi:ribosomal protein S18 acetylase RimI-like enzyme